MTHATDERGLPRGLFAGLVGADLSAIDEEVLERDEAEVQAESDEGVRSMANALSLSVDEIQASIDWIMESFEDLCEVETEIRSGLPRTARRAGRTPTRRSLRRRSEKGRSSKKINRE